MGGWVKISAKFIVGVAGLAIASPTLADDVYPQDVAEQAIKLQPISAWNLDYGEDSCRLTRAFGSEGAQHILALEQFAPDPGFRIIVAGPELAEWRGKRGLELGLRSDTPLAKVENYSSGSHHSLGAMLVLPWRLTEDYPPEGEPRTIGVDLGLAAYVKRAVLKSKRGAISFETGDMRPVFEAMNACTRDLLASWGLDPEAHSRFTPPVYREPTKLFRKFLNALPNRIRNSTRDQSFKWRLIIDDSGRVESCHDLSDSANAEAQKIGCEVYSRIRFEPAKNASGQAIRSYFAFSLTSSSRSN